MRALVRVVVTSALAMCLLSANSLAATLTLTVNEATIAPGQTFSLSADIAPNGDTGTLADLYVAVITPTGSLLTLDNTLAWVTSITPIVRSFSLASLHAANFYSMAMPSVLAKGQYTFYFLAFPAGQDPLGSQGNLGISAALMTFQDAAATAVTLTTTNAACTVNQACNAPLVASVTGGSSPYHFQQDSFAYGTRPLNTNIDLLTGNIVGTPTVAGSYPFQICAVDLGGNQNCQPVTVTVAESTPTTTARVFIGGSVALFTQITLDGQIIKDTTFSNLSYYTTMTTGNHALEVKCTEVYCFSYLGIEAPSGYTITPTSIDSTPNDIPPGTTRSYTLTLSQQ